MRRSELSISVLPAWARLNDVLFYDIHVENIEERGFGLVADRTLSSEDTFDIPALLRLPCNLILSAENIEEYAKFDKNFQELLSSAGGVSTRGDILLFLLMQMTMTTPDAARTVGVSNPWTEYLRMLSSDVTLPTTWPEEQRLLLTGTSLELAITSKMSALQREYDQIREVTNTIPWCQNVWWDHGVFTIYDWVRLDSWYRSRCLELPGSGEVMIPCLDMVNHSNQANAYYEQAASGEVVLLLKPNRRVEAGEEITISYGSSKSAAEMLFSYGFVDEDIQTQSLVLDLQPLPDDPLGKAKVAVFSGAPRVRVSSEVDTVDWSSPFAFLMCLNEEDGLEFRVLQEADGSHGQLQVFWQGKDVTNSTEKFDEHINEDANKEIFMLRAVTILQARIQQQMEHMYQSTDIFAALQSSMIGLDKSALTAASRLRRLETTLLEKAYDTLESQKFSLIGQPAVQTYLASMNHLRADADQAAGEDETTNDEDFS